MTVARLPRWDVTPIEIALDLEPPRLDNPSCLVFSGPAEPRVCLVATFALTPQLKRIATAIERAMPQRLPTGLRIASAKSRCSGWTPGAVTIAPMLALLRLQRKFVAAISPGLADCRGDPWQELAPEMETPSARFVGNFIAEKTVPILEPSRAAGEFGETRVRATGVTLYRLGRRGTPESMLAHWSYPAAGRVPL